MFREFIRFTLQMIKSCVAFSFTLYFEVLLKHLCIKISASLGKTKVFVINCFL